MLTKNKIILILFLFFSSAASAAQLDWVGGASPNPNSWADKNNWRIGPLDLFAPGAAPTSADDVTIPLASSNQPIVLTGTTALCKSLTTGAANGIILTVNGTLTVSGQILQNPPLVSLLGLGGTVVTTITGTGTVNCASMQIGSTTFLGLAVATVNQLSLISTVSNLKITGDLGIYGTSNTVLLGVSLLQVNNSAFYLRGGTTTLGGQIITSTTAGTSGAIDITIISSASANFTIDVPSGSALNPKLVLTNAAPINSTSKAGSIDFYNNGGGSGISTVEYSGAATQTIYTESTTQLNNSPATYQNITFSLAGTKSIISGDLSIYGNWASVSGKVDAISNNPNVIFKGGTQSVSDTLSDSGNGVVFKNVFFQGTGTKTMSGSGKFAVSSLGILTMGGSATLASGNILTLKSDVSGSATVASVPSGTAITGNVNVQRYVNGGAWYYRGYRLLTSPVNNGSGNFTLEYLKLSAFVTGTTKATGGFDASPNANNPSIYFFRENTAYTSNSFTTGNFRGVNSLGSSPYSFDNEGSTYSLPSGNGFLFFFRGDRSSGIASATVAAHVPENTTFTATGGLNQGNITVKQWYTGGALIYTTTVGSRVQGYNLVGNPYASTINFEKFNRKGTSGAVADANSSIYISGQKAQIYTTTPANVPPLVFIWAFNPTTKQYETYQQKATAITMADTTTTVNPGIQSVTGGAASNMIASGQGFFIRATASGQTMTFRESAKTNTQPNPASLTGLFSIPKDKTPIVMAFNPQSKFAATNTSNSDAKPYAWPTPLLRLKLIKDSINFDAVVIVLVKGISAAYNADKDAEDLGGNGAPESLSALSSDSVKITIHRRPIPGKQQEVIPLFADATASGDYKFRLTDLENMPDLYEVWIKDNLTKDSVLVKQNGEYAFTIDKGNPASFGSNRFQIIIRQGTADMAKVIDFNAQKVIDGSKLVWSTTNEANYTAYVAERSTDEGKTFHTLDTVYSNGSKSYSLVDTKPAQGLNQYRLTQIDLNGDTTLSKVVPLMYADTKTNIIAETMNIYPNPATDVIHAQMLLKNDGAINYKINITNSEGKVMATATSSQPTWQNNVGAFIPGTYIMQVVNSSNNTVIGVKKFIKK